MYGKLGAGALLLVMLFGGAAVASAQVTHPGTGAAHPAAHPARARAVQNTARQAAQFINGELALTAQTIGISEADLKTALKNGQTPAQLAQAHNVTAQTVIDAVVKDIMSKAQARPNWATTTAAQKTQFTTRVQNAVTTFVNKGLGANTRARLQKIGRSLTNEVSVAAQTIGISPADLKTAVKGGQTVAQVAQAHNVTADAVITAVVNDITSKAQARPNWANLTDQQKTQFTTKVHDRVAAWVNGTAKPTQ